MSTFNFEQLLVANELGEVIRLHNQAIERLSAFREQHPSLIAPNLARMAEENLKENVSVLYRELNNLHKPKAEQRRHVCRDCHNVFVVALPGGICDECRSKVNAPGGAYGGRPQMPEAESDTVSDVNSPPQVDDAPLERDLSEEVATEEEVAEGVALEVPAQGEEIIEEEIPLTDVPPPADENEDEESASNEAEEPELDAEDAEDTAGTPISRKHS